MSASSSSTPPPATLSVAVYTPQSSIRHPLRLVSEIGYDLWRCRELSWILFTRDLRAQFRQSILGYVWLFVPVVATTLVWMFLSSMQVVHVKNTDIPYPAFVLLGTITWGTFAASVTQPLTSFNDSRTVLMRLKVPAEAFLVSGTGRVLFDLGVRLAVLIPVLAVMGLPPASTAWLYPLAMICTIITGLAIGVLLIPLGALYTDVSRALATLLTFGMYLTPVVFMPPQSGWTASLIQLNPLTPHVMASRDWLVSGHSDYALGMFATTAAAAVLLCLGLVAFRIVLPHIIERMGM